MSNSLHAQHHSDAAQQLQVIYTDIDQRVRAMTAARPNWPCRQGCDNCCRQLAQPPELTAAEWHVVRQGFTQLPPETQHDVVRRI